MAVTFYRTHLPCDDSAQIAPGPWLPLALRKLGQHILKLLHPDIHVLHDPAVQLERGNISSWTFALEAMQFVEDDPLQARQAVTDIRKCVRVDHTNTDQPVRRTSSSRALLPTVDVPERFRPGDQVAMVPTPGTTARIPPPTPDFPGRPIR